MVVDTRVRLGWVESLIVGHTPSRAYPAEGDVPGNRYATISDSNRAIK